MLNKNKKLATLRLLSVLTLVIAVGILAPAVTGLASSPDQIVTQGRARFYNPVGTEVTVSPVLGSNAVVSVEKTVAPASGDNEFDITLDIKTSVDITEVKMSSDAAVVMVLDVSPSMFGLNDTGTNHIPSLIAAANNFLDSLAREAGDSVRYVSLVTFGGDASIKSGWVNITVPANLTNLKNIISLQLTEVNATCIDGGLQLARNLLRTPAMPNGKDGNPIENRSVILFSDGGTNTISNPFTGTSVVNYTQGTSITGQNLASGSYDATARSYAESMAAVVKNSTSFTVSSTAYPKHTAYLYTIAFGNEAPTTWLRDNIATNASYAYNAVNAYELNNAFAAIAKRIESWAEAWVVTDPMGQNIEFLTTISPTDIASGRLAFQNNTLSWDLKKTAPNSFSNNIFTYTYTYRIKLDTTSSTFVPETPYPTNGLTTLTYVMVEDNIIVGDVQTATFAIPAVKGYQRIIESSKSVSDASGDGLAAPGETLTFTISLTNKGNYAIVNESVSDTLSELIAHIDDPNLNAVMINNNGAVSFTTVSSLRNGIVIPRIEPGATVTLTFNVRVKDDLNTVAIAKLRNVSTHGSTEIPTYLAPGEKNAYINGSLIAQNGTAAEYQEVAAGDLIQYEIIFNKGFASWQTEPNPVFQPKALQPGKVSFINGSFENPRINDQYNYTLFYQNEVPGWNTRPVDPAYNGTINAEHIEFQRATVSEAEFAPYCPDGSTQYVELSASIVQVLYQVCDTVPGSKIYYEFYHGARKALNSPLVNNDMMLFNIRTAGQTSGGFQLICSDTAVRGADYNWGYYAGSYIVPPGQTRTELSFEPIYTNTGDITKGNFVDGVRFFTSSYVDLTKFNNAPSGRANVDDIVTYTILAQNRGESDAANVVIRDVLPVGTELVPNSIRIDGALSANYTYNSATRELSVNVGGGATAAAGGLIRGDGSFSTDCNSNYAISFQIKVIGGVIAQNYKYENQARVDYQDRYDPDQARYVNYSNVDEFVLDRRMVNALITDILPEGLTYVSHTAPPGSTFTNMGQICFWTFSQLPDYEITVTVTARVEDATEASYVNYATLLYDGKTSITNSTYHILVKKIGPPTEVEEKAGDKKVALLWEDPIDSVVSAYQLKIDNGAWITINLADLTLDTERGKWYYLFQGLTNEVEYTFQIRALNSEGIEGEIFEIKSTPKPIGIMDGEETDLLTIHNVNVMPSGGWPVMGGLSIIDPYLATIELPSTITFATIHVNDIKLSLDATLNMYSSFTYQNEITIVDRLDNSFNWLPEVHLYLKVTSGNQQNFRYYDITVRPSGPSPVPMASISNLNYLTIPELI